MEIMLALLLSMADFQAHPALKGWAKVKRH
jgi:hypothetical protein